jgi:hypothetical protein
MTRLGLVAAACLSCLACGPEHDGARVYEPRVCGQDGPLQLVAFEGARSWSVLSPVDDRWLVLAGGHQPPADGNTPSFEAYMLEPCGGGEVRLAEALWPIILGDTLLGCDVRDGTISSLDSHTGEAGAMIDTGLQCDALSSGSAFALLRHVESQTVAVVAATGELTRTSVPFVRGGDEQPVEPHLVAPSSVLPVSSEHAERIAGTDGAMLLLDDDATLWRFTASGAVPVANDVASFLVREDVVVIRRQEHAEAEAFPVLLLDLTDGTSSEGPEVTHLRMTSGYLHLPNAFFDPVERATFPHPFGLHAAHGVLRAPAPSAFAWGSGLRVWEIETGDVLIDRDDGPQSGGFVWAWNDVVLAENDSAARHEFWSYPLDGSSPELLYRAPAGIWPSLVSPAEVLTSAKEGPTDVGYENLSTGESWVLMPRVVSNVVSTTVELAESAVFEGRRPRFYLVEEDGRTALSVTLLPER